MSDKEKDLQKEKSQEQVEEMTQEVDDIVNEEQESVIELEQLKTTIEELEDKNLRLQAEIVNIRQRNQKEREDAAKYRSQDLAKALLPAIDNLERALAVENQDDNVDALKKGVEMVLENMKETLRSQGIEVIAAIGETFDPTVHQAVQTVPADDENQTDTIVQELQKGYKLYDRVLRPSMVIVAQ